jgi:hypothetical protein
MSNDIHILVTYKGKNGSKYLNCRDWSAWGSLEFGDQQLDREEIKNFLKKCRDTRQRGPYDFVLQTNLDKNANIKLRLVQQFQEEPYLPVTPGLHHHQWKCGSFAQQRLLFQLQLLSRHHR